MSVWFVFGKTHLGAVQPVKGHLPRVSLLGWFAEVQGFLVSCSAARQSGAALQPGDAHHTLMLCTCDGKMPGMLTQLWIM